MRNCSSIALIFLWITSCIDPLDIRIPIYEKLLVVDGAVYEGPGPHEVKLSYSENLQSSRSEFRDADPVSNAEVFILTSDGEEFQFVEDEPGIYRIEEGVLHASIGKVYQLRIRSVENQIYESTLQRLESAGVIEDLRFEFVRDVIYIPDTRQNQNGFVVTIDSRAAQGSNGFLRWRYTGTFEINTQPERRIKVVANPSGLPIEVPDPLECSGYIYTDSLPGVIIQTANCICCSCWIDEDDGKVKLSNAQFANAKIFNNIKIAVIPIDVWRFYTGYSIEVEQLSLSEDVHQFWKEVQSQQQGSGSLFQPNISQIKGNIRNIQRPEEPVLGIFSASAIVRRRIYIDRFDIPYCLDPPNPFIPCLPPPIFLDDCRLKFKRSTNERPEFW